MKRPNPFKVNIIKPSGDIKFRFARFLLLQQHFIQMLESHYAEITQKYESLISHSSTCVVANDQRLDTLLPELTLRDAVDSSQVLVSTTSSFHGPVKKNEEKDF